MTGVEVPELRVAWLLIWFLVGAGVALALVRGGLPWPWAALALVGWPVLFPLLRPLGGREPPVPAGPLASAITETFAALASLRASPLSAPLDCDEELVRLQASLERIDARLAVVDTILADGGPELLPLRAARARSAAECHAVLQGIRNLRVQLGLLTLAGDTAPVRTQLSALQARVAALEELDQNRGQEPLVNT